MDPRRLVPPLLTVTTLCALLASVVSVARHWPAGEADARPVADAVVVGAEPTSPRHAAPRTTPVTEGPGAVLASWDRARARAWADGDPEALRGLYTPGSSAGRADLAMLARWLDRGLRVTGLETQTLALRTEERGRHSLVLVVTDRVVGGRVMGPDHQVALLPADRPSTRTVVLRRVAGRWLVATVADGAAAGPVEAQPSAAARTSRTSSSAKS